MKTGALKTQNNPVLNLVPSGNEYQTAKVIYGVNGYSRIKEIFSIKPEPPAIDQLMAFISESEKDDPNWFSSYE